MKSIRLLVLAVGLMMAPGAMAAGLPDSVWITLGQGAYDQLRQIEPAVDSSTSRSFFDKGTASRVYVVRVDFDVLGPLSQRIHRQLHHCGGFIVHESLDSARQSLTRSTAAEFTRPAYEITHQNLVSRLVAETGSPGIENVILQLSRFHNRYLDSQYGVKASDWLATKWRSLASGHEGVTVEQINGGRFAQSSVVLTIEGTEKPDEIVVIGAHLDSINIEGSGSLDERRAPGADDDASGVASETEMLRVLLANDYQPQRTIKVMAYAGEELGLLGSDYIAGRFAERGADVVGVIQLDMTNYMGSPDDIYLISDNTDEQQNRFLEALAAQYIPEVTVSSTSCGYACSDHVSWSERGYPASFPFESAFGEEDPYIHTAEDTYSNAGGQSLHALKFARLALAFAVEIGDVARDPSSTGDNGNPGDGNNNDGASEPDPATSFGDGGSGGVGGLALLMLGLVALTRRLCLRTVSDYR